LGAESLKIYQKFAIITTLATYFLIFVGGLVRVSGAGLGCPDWPKCFGRWIPPLSADQLPPDIDPALFNFTLAWIEYINRLIGVVIGLLVLITALLALRYYFKEKHISIPSVLALVLVVFQAWLGGMVVRSELEPLIVSIHMGVALVIVSLLIYASQKAWYKETNLPVNASLEKRFDIWILALWILAIIQVTMGTQIRSSIEMIQQNYPLLSQPEMLSKVHAIKYFHTILGIIIGVGTWITSFILYKKLGTSSPIFTQSAWAATLFISFQIVIGFFMTFVELYPLAQLFHLWIASLYVGLLLFMFVEVRRYRNA
jgi:cytochrome c oxidase assembly protein subunit 15